MTWTLRCPNCQWSFGSETERAPCPRCGPYECFCTDPKPDAVDQCGRCGRVVLIEVTS